MSRLLIVESPGRIKNLRSILGPGWNVQASVGHIRQLANEISDNLGFVAKNGWIECKYEPRDNRVKKTIANLKAAAQQAEEVFIASDPDREGEVSFMEVKSDVWVEVIDEQVSRLKEGS